MILFYSIAACLIESPVCINCFWAGVDSKQQLRQKIFDGQSDFNRRIQLTKSLLPYHSIPLAEGFEHGWRAGSGRKFKGWYY